jgi:hypothetical protein
MVNTKKLPLPETTEECTSLLNSIISSIESSSLFEQKNAYELLEILYKKRCKKALSWLYEKYHRHPLLYVQKFAKKALEYRGHLDP